MGCWNSLIETESKKEIHFTETQAWVPVRQHHSHNTGQRNPLWRARAPVFMRTRPSVRLLFLCRLARADPREKLVPSDQLARNFSDRTKLPFNSQDAALPENRQDQRHGYREHLQEEERSTTTGLSPRLTALGLERVSSEGEAANCEVCERGVPERGRLRRVCAPECEATRDEADFSPPVFREVPPSCARIGQAYY
ncbi:hypothetical protein MHYP_G00003350 [Metynnis hypsauchen]